MGEVVKALYPHPLHHAHTLTPTTCSATIHIQRHWRSFTFCLQLFGLDETICDWSQFLGHNGEENGMK